VNPSATHLVLIPSYDTGPLVVRTVHEALAHWAPVWVVVDGSTDGSAALLEQLARTERNLRVFVLPENRGKGAAVLHGLMEAQKAGFTHALAMDADGQHPAWLIETFMRESQSRPRTLVLGKPVFDTSAPLVRVRGRKLSNWWTNLETLWTGVGDSLYGFRVYPIAPLIEIMRRTMWMRRYDFDAEAAVRLIWRGLPVVNIDAPVKYLRKDEGGVSHFNYLRDNVLLVWMHVRLVFGFLLRSPVLVVRRLAGG
jgi:glycosyltransferase involved in cell wall biosynthesis